MTLLASGRTLRRGAARIVFSVSCCKRAAVFVCPRERKIMSPCFTNCQGLSLGYSICMHCFRCTEWSLPKSFIWITRTVSFIDISIRERKVTPVDTVARSFNCRSISINIYNPVTVTLLLPYYMGIYSYLKYSNRIFAIFNESMW